MDQIQRKLSGCICATNIGTNVCSETRNMTDNICVISSSTYNMGILAMAMEMGMYVNNAEVSLNGNSVSLYHVSACILGCQQKLLGMGPKAMALDTNQHHKLADNAKIIRIHIMLEYLII